MAQVIVQFHKTVPVPERITRLEALGNPIKQGLDRAAIYLIEVPAGTESYWIRRYTAVDGVRNAEENIPHRLA